MKDDETGDRRRGRDRSSEARHPGRGAPSNPAGRFEPRDVAPLEDDVWWAVEEEPARVETTVLPDESRSILATNDSPDVPFDRSVNPYRGCEHGCAYCFARPSHSFLGLSPGLDFETRLLVKEHAAELLRRELSRPGYRPEVLVVGANTDPYQPVEKRLRVTRGVLEVLAEARHPTIVLTKAALILRDLDLLAPMSRDGIAAVMVSITTLDDELAHRMEPRAASPARRLRVIRELSGAGVRVGVLISPMIPALNDHEMEGILLAAVDAGATAANYAILRLPHELRDLFPEWLRRHYPSRAGKVLGLLRAMRGGELYDSRFEQRMRGSGEFAEVLARRFDVARRRLGIERERFDLRTDLFRPPGPAGQKRLF